VLKLYGYTGKVLSIDLTHEKISTISLKEDTLRKFLGGKGLAVYLLLKYLPLKLDALDPDNVIVLSTGPLTGVLPFSNQLIVASKSPLTGSFAWSRSGGKFPQMIKRSGFDAILIKGRSETPVYLWIDDGEVEFRKAIHLWGKDTYSCSKKLLQETRKEAAISVIGPAGELLVRFASIKNDLYFTAGRGGIGAVYGAKKLKGVAIYGTKPIRVAYPERVKNTLIIKYYKFLTHRKDDIRKIGGLERVVDLNRIGATSVKNFQLTHHQGAEGLIRDLCKLSAFRKGCDECPVECFRFARVNGMEVKLHPEAVAMLGLNLELFQAEDLLKLLFLAEKYGVDAISAGNIIGWATEVYERGLLSREFTGELELRYGDCKVFYKLLNFLSERRGFGAVLAEGLVKAAKIVGKNSLKYAVHVGGLESSCIDPRGRAKYALGYAVTDVVYSCLDFHFKETPQEQCVVEAVIDEMNRLNISNSLVICPHLNVGASEVVEMLKYVTGWEDVAERDLTAIAERVETAVRMFNIREKLTSDQELLPPRWLEEAIPSGPSKGAKINLEDLQYCITHYYKLRGWDDRGVPLQETIEKLGLSEVYRQAW